LAEIKLILVDRKDTHMRVFFKRSFLVCLGLVLGDLQTGWIHAQTPIWPNKSVRIIVPAPPGSAPDGQVRIIANQLSGIWKQNVLIENVVGAAGNIGVDRVAKASADGYTLLYNTMGPIAVNVTLMAGKLPYDPLKDLVPISLATKTPNLMTVAANSPFKSVADALAYARAHPEKIRYGTPGPGTTQHLMGESLNLSENISMVSVPYKSSAQMTTDGLSGQFELLFHNAPVLLPYVQSGQLRALAITSKVRSPRLPNVPTMMEAGIKDFELNAWFGFMAPAGTPKGIVDKMAKDIQTVLKLPEVHQQIADTVTEVVGSSPDAYDAFIKFEIKKWAEVIQKANISDH
jgi:tripartite-type tricarboxylate transporter receptor subunit TctC